VSRRHQRPELLGLRIVSGFEGRDRRGGNLSLRYNAAPSQKLWAIASTPKRASARSTS
jgi:hypothetical protein